MLIRNGSWLKLQATTEAAQKTQKVAMKKVKRGDREFQELVDEMIADLVQQDMDVAGEAARKKAGKEHEVNKLCCSGVSYLRL